RAGVTEVVPADAERGELDAGLAQRPAGGGGRFVHGRANMYGSEELQAAAGGRALVFALALLFALGGGGLLLVPVHLEDVGQERHGVLGPDPRQAPLGVVAAELEDAGVGDLGAHLLGLAVEFAHALVVLDLGQL